MDTLLSCPECHTHIDSVQITGEVLHTPDGLRLVAVIAPCGHHTTDPHLIDPDA